VRDQRAGFPVRLLCAVLGVSRSGFYRWSREPRGRVQRRRETLLTRIRAVHGRSRGTYGSPRVHRALALEGGAPCRNTVAALMKAHGIKGVARRRFRVRTTDPRPAAAPDLVSGSFRADGPDRVWAGDITYIPTDEGYVYLAGVMDLYSRRVVGWSMTDHLRAELVIDALAMAISRRRPAPGLIHHSDRGCQYASAAFRRLLDRHRMRPSMSRRGSCYDNAPVESLWSTIKRELVHPRRFRTRAEARGAVFEYIEVFYNRQRLHSVLGYLSPEQFEARHDG
jgi:transposase InsO family protein